MLERGDFGHDVDVEYRSPFLLVLVLWAEDSGEERGRLGLGRISVSLRGRVMIRRVVNWEQRLSLGRGIRAPETRSFGDDCVGIGILFVYALSATYERTGRWRRTWCVSFRIQALVGELLEIEGERDEDIAGDGDGDADDGLGGEGGEIVHGGYQRGGCMGVHHRPRFETG